MDHFCWLNASLHTHISLNWSAKKHSLLIAKEQAWLEASEKCVYFFLDVTTLTNSCTTEPPALLTLAEITTKKSFGTGSKPLSRLEVGSRCFHTPSIAAYCPHSCLELTISRNQHCWQHSMVAKPTSPKPVDPACVTRCQQQLATIPPTSKHGGQAGSKAMKKHRGLLA